MFQKNINYIIACCWLLILFICGLLFYLNFLPQERNTEIVSCGNKSVDDNVVLLNDSNSLTYSGKEIFITNCAPCHHPIKASTGPALKDVISNRSKEWLYKFVSESNYMEKDNRAKELQMEYTISCPKSPHLSSPEAIALCTYLSMIN